MQMTARSSCYIFNEYRHLFITIAKYLYVLWNIVSTYMYNFCFSICYSCVNIQEQILLLEFVMSHKTKNKSSKIFYKWT